MLNLFRKIVSGVPRVCGLLVLCALALLGCSESEPARQARAETQARPVIAARISYAPERVEVEAVGTSRALRSVSIRPRVAGQIESVHIQPGQKVTKGDVLFSLDSRDEALALRNAQLELADAERLLQRYRQTKDSGAVTQSALDDADSAVARARIAVDRSQVNLAYQQVLAPFTGYVGFTDIDPGAWVDTSTALTTLDDRSQLLVTFSLPELLLGQIDVGQEIELSTWRQKDAIAAGEVVEIDSRVDDSERMFRVRAHVDNSDDTLRPGMSFRIALSLLGNEYALVPEVSLQWGARGSYVWAVVDGVAQRRVATIVQRLAGKVLVDVNLPEGALVVLEGIQMLREGMPVRVDQVVNADGVPVANAASAADSAEVSGD
ncbi:efflux RND transporter periplasmic adaptor subunit [Gilvimarinus sp. DA14]|uniref:efflux RND transporter periplasmic adaptor subunit n=1 Tax=Gilvimarinus sp. DA14 TaxID=2956798 RepID=UPI0020B6DEEC|nr:efflux RND transporter periplasmic adaptor subunit [Gilvimarinus sp. DA14]UTF61418.1 efflux RND transporter periplasmic adaptor subunit [Gilvimarinus sp. DA14]